MVFTLHLLQKGAHHWCSSIRFSITAFSCRGWVCTTNSATLDISTHAAPALRSELYISVTCTNAHTRNEHMRVRAPNAVWSDVLFTDAHAQVRCANAVGLYVFSTYAQRHALTAQFTSLDFRFRLALQAGSRKTGQKQSMGQIERINAFFTTIMGFTATL